MKKITALVFQVFVASGILACSDFNRHQFDLRYDKVGRLTIVCHNCYYYFGDYETDVEGPIVDREIDGTAIELLSSVEFCGLGDTTPDGWLKIETDLGYVAEFGILFPHPEYNPSLRIQSIQTGLGQGCNRSDQDEFEEFFDAYASKPNEVKHSN